MRAHSFGLACFVALAGCGGTSAISVQGNALNLVETNYGAWVPGTGPGAFCGALDIRGQFQVMLNDFAACTEMRAKKDNNSVFHKRAETNLRLIFPSMLTKIPKVNTFHVKGGVNCAQGTNPDGAEAVAFFSVDDGLPRQGGAASLPYDVINLMADSGTITITDFTTNDSLIGSYDLMFGSDHVVGSFSALFCSGLTPGYGI